MATVTTDYEATVQRILDILQDDKPLNELIAEWRFGELPEDTPANVYPAIYVTTARNPEVERTNYGFTDGERMGIQKVVTEYWIVVISDPSMTPADAQKTVYRIRRLVVAILQNHLRLRRTPDGDALSDHTDIHSTPRLTSTEGRLIASMTIMVRVLTHEGQDE